MQFLNCNGHVDCLSRVLVISPDGISAKMSQLKYLNKENNTSKTTRKDPPPPPVAVTSQKDEHRYEEVGVGQKEENLYDKLVYNEDAKEINNRLQSIEENQEKMAAEFRSHYQFLISEIKKLQDALEGVKTSNINLQKSLVESSTVVQESVESLKSQFLETSDHLGQHVLQVRKDIVALSKRDPNSPPPVSGFESPSPHGATDTRVKHMFEWDIQSVDNLVKTQGHVSSHSYHIGDLNYKVLGGAEFLKDSIMSVRIYGESTHPSGTDHLTKSGRFECKVMVIDRSGAMTDWLIGKVVGNFFKEKMWMVGNVSVPELKKKNYLAQNKTLKLKFTIDIFK